MTVERTTVSSEHYASGSIGSISIKLQIPNPPLELVRLVVEAGDLLSTTSLLGSSQFWFRLHRVKWFHRVSSWSKQPYLHPPPCTNTLFITYATCASPSTCTFTCHFLQLWHVFFSLLATRQRTPTIM